MNGGEPENFREDETAHAAAGQPVYPPPKGIVRDYVETIIVAVLFVLFIKTFVFQQFKIPTPSMENTLLIGDHLMVNKFIYGVPTGTFIDRVLPTRNVRRQDIIVFRYPKDPSVDFIKRVIGIPGDDVSIRRKVVFLDGEPLDEPHRRLSRPGFAGLGDNMPPRLIPRRRYFVMGDNRDNSNDSRFWGTVPRRLIRGRAFVIWWSFAEKPGDWEKRDIKDRLIQLYDKVRYFFSRTRWHRMFEIVR